MRFTYIFSWSTISLSCVAICLYLSYRHHLWLNTNHIPNVHNICLQVYRVNHLWKTSMRYSQNWTNITTFKYLWQPCAHNSKLWSIKRIEVSAFLFIFSSENFPVASSLCYTVVMLVLSAHMVILFFYAFPQPTGEFCGQELLVRIL